MSDDATGDQVDPISPAGTVYQSLVGQQLAAEYDRRKALEGRGATLVTASSTLTALIFGLAVLVVGKDFVLVNRWCIGFLLAALVPFVLSAVVAIIVQAYGPKYDVTPRETLRSLARDDAQWSRGADDATRMWVSQQAQTTCSLRDVNDCKARLVTVSLVLQVLAALLLSAAIGLELYGRL